MQPVGFSAKCLQALSAATSEDELLYALIEDLPRRLQIDEADLFLAEHDRSLVLRASTGTPEYINRCRLGRGIGLCGQVFESESTVLIPSSAHEHPENVMYPGVDEKDWESMVILPIGSPALGVLVLFHSEPIHDPETMLQAGCDAAEQCALAVRSFQNLVRVGAGSNRLEAVSQVSKSIASSPYLEEILQLLVNITAQRFNYAVCTVRLLDESRNELVLRATQAHDRAYQRKPAIRLGESIAGRALSEASPVIVADVQSEPDYIGHDLAAEQGLRSMVCIPLMLQERALGVMSCYTTEVREFDEDEIRSLETIAKQAAYSIEHAKLQVRSTLIQEMHHRVKNNLQQVASLLRIQLHHEPRRTLEESLHDTLSRILAISAVHDLLSRDDLDHVGLVTLAESIVQHQRDSLLLPDVTIRFEVRGHNVTLSTAQATQVALIMNELIQNAIEHGFQAAKDGDIHVTVEESGNEVALWVSNNGDQLSPEFNFLNASNLGLKIVENLSKALRGRFVLEKRLGWTVAEVKFTRSSLE